MEVEDEDPQWVALRMESHEIPRRDLIVRLIPVIDLLLTLLLVSNLMACYKNIKLN